MMLNYQIRFKNITNLEINLNKKTKNKAVRSGGTGGGVKV